MERIKDDDPRLRGIPIGGVFWSRPTSWRVKIEQEKEIVYQEYINAKKYGGDVEAAKQAAETQLQRANDDLGLRRNKCIVLTNGDLEMDVGGNIKMIFSPERLNDLIQHHWYFIKKKSGQYYVKAIINTKNVYCHRFLMNAQKGQFVDHRNGNPLQNTTSNMRLVSSRMNCENRALRKNTTGVTGVSLKKDVNGAPLYYRANWKANGKSCGKQFAVSKYASADEALTETVAYRHKMEEKYDIQSRRRTLEQAIEEDNGEENMEDSNRKRKRQDEEEEEKEEENEEVLRPLKKQRTLDELFARVQ